MSLKTIIAAVAKGQVLLPKLQDYVAKIRRLQAAGKLSERSVVLKDCKMSMKALKERKEEFNHGEVVDGDYFHPSSMGSCLRMLWFSRFDAPRDAKTDKDHLKEWFIFEVGTYFHLLCQNLVERAGLLVKREVAIMDKELRIMGHADAIVKIDGIQYVLEIKTINSRQFTLLGKEPKEAHKLQVHMYMKALGIKRAIVLYYDKDRSELKEFVIAFDKALYKKYCGSRMDIFFKSIAEKKMPDREGESPNAPPCSWCSYATVCYSDIVQKPFLKKLKQGSTSEGVKEKPTVAKRKGNKPSFAGVSKASVRRLIKVSGRHNAANGAKCK